MLIKFSLLQHVLQVNDSNSNGLILMDSRDRIYNNCIYCNCALIIIQGGDELCPAIQNQYTHTIQSYPTKHFTNKLHAMQSLIKSNTVIKISILPHLLLIETCVGMTNIYYYHLPSFPLFLLLLSPYCFTFFLTRTILQSSSFKRWADTCFAIQVQLQDNNNIIQHFNYPWKPQLWILSSNKIHRRLLVRSGSLRSTSQPASNGIYSSDKLIIIIITMIITGSWRNSHLLSNE